MVLDGRAAALWGAGIGWPGFQAVAESAGGARFIAPDADEIARIRAKHTFLKPLTVPADSYPNQTAPINSVGSWSFVLARESLPDDVAYRLARTLHGAEAALCKKLPQACETTAANTVAAAPNSELIHPGVMKYFREVGVVSRRRIANSDRLATRHSPGLTIDCHFFTIAHAGSGGPNASSPEILARIW